MKNAIKLAIKGGWKKGEDPTFFGTVIETIDGHYMCMQCCVCDPLFWQALGNSLGWKQPYFCRKHGSGCMPVDWVSWKDQWHRFIDHLAEGKDAESFFKELLKS